MTYQVATTSVTKEMTVWIVFLDFLIQGGDLGLRPRLFTVLIYPALLNQILRAATVVLKKNLPKETLPIIFALSPLGCMYLESRQRPHPFGLKVPQLRTQSNPLPGAADGTSLGAMMTTRTVHTH